MPQLTVRSRFNLAWGLVCYLAISVIAKNHLTSQVLVFCYSLEIQTPEITKVPLNQSARLGSNVTLNCTATGHPKPTVTWTKNSDSYSVQSNPRAKVIAGYGKGVSQLIIAGVTSEDYGEYQCVANNSAGVKISSGAFLSPVTDGMIVKTFTYVIIKVKC